MNEVRRERLSTAAGCRAEARRCIRLADAAATPHGATLLRELAREYETRAAALEQGMPVPPAQFVMA